MGRYPIYPKVYSDASNKKETKYTLMFAKQYRMVDYDPDPPQKMLNKRVNKPGTIVFDLDETLVKCVPENKVDRFELLSALKDIAIRIEIP